MIILDGTPTKTTAGNQQITSGSKQQPNLPPWYQRITWEYQQKQPNINKKPK